MLWSQTFLTDSLFIFFNGFNLLFGNLLLDFIILSFQINLMLVFTFFLLFFKLTLMLILPFLFLPGDLFLAKIFRSG